MIGSQVMTVQVTARYEKRYDDAKRTRSNAHDDNEPWEQHARNARLAVAATLTFLSLGS